jgi:hypothetical protein
MKTVYVHAFEYATSGGGFDWYHTAEAADKAFEEGYYGPDDAEASADFRFDVTFPADTPAEQITQEIDDNIFDYCASASKRRVGQYCLKYWQENGMKMGTATEPHKEQA